MKKRNILLENLEAEIRAARQESSTTIDNTQTEEIIRDYYHCSVYAQPFAINFELKHGIYTIRYCEKLFPNGKDHSNNEKKISIQPRISIEKEKKIESDMIDYSGWDCPWCHDKGNIFLHMPCNNCGRVCSGSYSREIIEGSHEKNLFLCKKCGEVQYFTSGKKHKYTSVNVSKKIIGINNDKKGQGHLEQNKSIGMIGRITL